VTTINTTQKNTAESDSRLSC